MKIINTDGFLWLDVTSKANKLVDVFELFILHDDGSESLVDSTRLLNTALNTGQIIAIELCHLKDIPNENI